MNVRGIILAGGLSSRFGEDKALASIGNTPVIGRILNRLRELDLAVSIIANPARDYSFLECPVHFDAIPGKGPLGGLYTACLRYPEESFLALTCDMPGITRPLLETLLSSAKNGSRAAVIAAPERRYRHPFPGIYAASLKDRIEACLRDNQLSMESFLRDLPGLEVLDFFGFGETAFFNVNEKRDLERFNKLDPQPRG